MGIGASVTRSRHVYMRAELNARRQELTPRQTLGWSATCLGESRFVASKGSAPRRNGLRLPLPGRRTLLLVWKL